MIIEFINLKVTDDLHKIITVFEFWEATKMVLADQVRRKFGKRIYRQYF